MTPEISLPPPKTVISLAWISLAGAFIVLTLKVIAYLQTNSGGILSDALESMIDIVSAIVTLRVVKLVSEPADEQHPYGHGKLEYFSVAFEGGLIAFAAILIGFGAGKALIFGGHVGEIESGLGLLTLTVIINGALAAFIYRRGKAARSQAMIAKSRHILADLVTTFSVMIGLGLVKLTGLVWIDSVAALIVAIHLVREGIQIIRQAIGGLIDEVDTDSLDEVSAAFSANRLTGIIDIHHLKLIRSGRFHHIDLHMVVPEFWNIIETHNMMKDFEKKVMAAYNNEGEIAFHVDPCHQEYCRTCDLENCQIRQLKFIQHRKFTPESLTKPPVIDALLTSLRP